MSTIAHLLEDFGTPPPGSGRESRMNEEELESFRLDAFENGYKAGWDDALKSQSEEADRITEEFARNLQDLSFTYHEAHAHVMKSLVPLLQDLVDTVLPDAVRETIGLRVIDQMTEMARTHGAQKVEITTSPSDYPMVNNLLDRDVGFPVAAVADATLAEGQVFLRMGQDERQIDMQAVMADIREAVAGLLDETERTLKHG